MIGVDWGTTSFRAYRLADDGAVTDRIRADRGIMQVGERGFAATLRDAVGGWINDGERRVLLSGMAGSRQGWVEAPYLPCPAGLPEIAAGLISIPDAGRVPGQGCDTQGQGCDIRIVPGLRDTDAGGTPEVMRGEETQILGALDQVGPDALVCLPGSHSKWVRLRDRAIASFETFLSGEAYAAIRGGTILGRMMVADARDDTAFLRGVERSRDGHLLHHLFGVRSLTLDGRLSERSSASYLSGLMIGHEVGAALGKGGTVHLVGEPGLTALYEMALRSFGARAVVLSENAAAAGLHAIGQRVDWRL